MLDVVTIGDAMIALNPTMKGPMRFVHNFEKKVGGAELNFAIGCARLGLKAGWISRLGNDEFGKYILHFVRGEGIDTSHVKMVDNYPTSVYFKEILEDGTGRNFYYRNQSPILTLNLQSIDEEYIKSAKVLHISGVFSAIHEDNPKIIHHAIQIAKENNVLVSLDPNIRLKLWDKERAKEVLLSFLPKVDIFLTGVEEAEILFGTSDAIKIIEICKSFGITSIAVKKGEDGSIAYHNGAIVEADAIKASKVVDTVGAGDGFDAGFIYGVLQKWPLDRIVKISNTIGSMVVSVSGDNEGLPELEDVLIRLGEKQKIER